jgi:HD-GYP domain-containing protein (c-di-GMP phosphodiesterase class II)
MQRHKSRLYLITEIIPGMTLSKDAVTKDGRVALSAGVVLTANLIERLKYWYWDIRYINAYEPTDGDCVETGDVSGQQRFFRQYSETVGMVRTAFDQVRLENRIPIGELTELISQSVDPLLKSVGVINHLHMVRRRDDYTFHHSINVSIIAGMIGKWLGYPESKVTEIICAGMLHDVGKTQIPLEVLNKPGKLTAEEMTIMRRHPSLGRDLVQLSSTNLSDDICCGVLEHHERMDGTGYPVGMLGDQIHPYAKIIAVADIYDAMTSDRVYHRKISPFLVAEMMINEMFGRLDPEICTTFLNNLRDYFIGNVVELSDGRQGEVVHMGQFMASRPVVRTQDGAFIDLEKEKEVSIVKLVRA